MPSTWPGSLPQDPLLDYAEEPQDTRLRTDMGTGPAKMRRRFSAKSRAFPIQMVMTGAQLETFVSFYETTLVDGTLPFTWEDPRTDASADLYFVERPTWRAVGGGSGGASGTRKWRVSMVAEVLP